MLDSRKQVLLLVEDDAILALAEKKQLEKYGYEVIRVGTGEKAIEAIKTNPIIGLILMDIDLGPGLDGTQAAELILKVHDIPIIFLSSYLEPEMLEKTEKIASYGYIAKSTSLNVLDASIKMAFRLFCASKNSQTQKMELIEANKNMVLLNEDLRRSEGRLAKSESDVRNKLKAILEPTGPVAGLELSDIIDSKELQSLMEEFYKLTGILGAILDIKGNILVAAGWQDICTKFHRCKPISAHYCKESDISLTAGVEEGTFKLYRCKNNMWDMVTPLVIDGHHMGNIFIGQFLFENEEPDIGLFRRQAQEYGYDEGEYLEALERVPRFSRETVETGMSFYAKIAKLISSLSYSSVKLARTITENKQAEEKIGKLLKEKELLLKEVHHRIKNNMSTISSLLTLQASTVSEPSALGALRDAGNRVRSIALLYDKLYQATDFKELSAKNYLSSLVDEVVSNFPNGDTVRIEKNLADFMLDAKRLQSVGVIINELLTNIMKYAFMGRTHGHIAVSSATVDDQVELFVQDDGIGIPESVSFEDSTGFGLQLVHALTQQLDGTIRIDRGGGTKVVLAFAK